MTAQYVLEQRILGPHLTIDISEERYKELAHAREVLSEALDFEQRYELLLSNFISMELAFTEISLRAKVEPKYEYPDSAELLQQANRHVVNLLTALRGYADQVPQDFKCLDLDPGFGSLAKAELAKVFERSPDYRFMCGLRNHVQHKATAVHGFEGGSDDTKIDANGWVESVAFYANNNILGQDKEFKTRILEEQPEKIDVRRRARRCLQEIGVAHLALREVFAPHVAQARSAIESAIRDYENAGAESALGLCARRVGDKAADVPVFLNWDEVRVQLAQKNASPPKLWPRRTHNAPTVEQIVALREEAKHTPAQAAKAVFVPEGRWLEYEDGLPMPVGLFQLYQLKVGRHPTLSLQQRDGADGVWDLSARKSDPQPANNGCLPARPPP